MQMVAAARMKKAQDDAINSKPYTEKIADAVVELAKRVDPSAHKLLTEGNSTGHTLVILVSTNKGLCGGLNTTLFRQVTKWYDENTEFISLGKKGQRFLTQTNKPLEADFTSDDFMEKAQPMTELFIKGYLSGKYNEVHIVYNKFVNSLVQVPARKTLLPIAVGSIEDDVSDDKLWNDFLIEPTMSFVLDKLLPHYIETQVRSAIYESLASEQSARMMAMKNATDNANNLIDDLTLAYNRLRQEKITYEIADIVTARISME